MHFEKNLHKKQIQNENTLFHLKLKRKVNLNKEFI